MTFAYKAIALHPALSGLDKRVGAAILDHFNHKTGQCDPGTDRLASLLGVSIRTVLRSVERLDDVGLIGKVRHGGRLNRNSYQPDWERCRAFDAVWRASFDAAVRIKNCELSRDTCQDAALERVQPVTQTSNTNQTKGTSDGLPKEEQGEGSASHSSPSPSSRRPLSSSSLVAVSGAAPSATRSFTSSPRQPFSTSSTDAATQAALRRWNDALYRHYGHLKQTYEEIVEAIDQRTIDAATDAELVRRGGGIVYIAAKLRLGPLNRSATNDERRNERDGGEA